MVRPRGWPPVLTRILSCNPASENHDLALRVPVEVRGEVYHGWTGLVDHPGVPAVESPADGGRHNVEHTGTGSLPALWHSKTPPDPSPRTRHSPRILGDVR